METNNARPQTTTENIPWQERALHAETLLGEMQGVLAQANEELAYLKAQVRLLTAKRFGASSEKTAEGQQSLFFNEAEITAEPFSPEPDLTDVKPFKRRKYKGQRDDLLEGLPRNIIEYRLSEDELACLNCNNELHIIGKQVSQELRTVPAQFWVDEHVQFIYGCRDCEVHGDGENSFIVTAPRPNRPIANSIASPSSVAYIMDQKYTMGTPLYRQEQQWTRMGIKLSRQTMSNWILHCAENWLEPLFQRMRVHLLQQDIIHADDYRNICIIETSL